MLTVALRGTGGIKLPLAIGLGACIAAGELVLSTQTQDPSAAVTSIAKPTSLQSHVWPQQEHGILHVRIPQQAGGGLRKAPAIPKTSQRGQPVGPKATGAVQGSFQHIEACFFGKPKATQPRTRVQKL